MLRILLTGLVLVKRELFEKWDEYIELWLEARFNAPLPMTPLWLDGDNWLLRMSVNPLPCRLFFYVSIPATVLTTLLCLSADLIEMLLKLESECWSRDNFSYLRLVVWPPPVVPECWVPIPNADMTIFWVWLNLWEVSWIGPTWWRSGLLEFLRIWVNCVVEPIMFPAGYCYLL